MLSQDLATEPALGAAPKSSLWGVPTSRFCREQEGAGTLMWACDGSPQSSGTNKTQPLAALGASQEEH